MKAPGKDPASARKPSEWAACPATERATISTAMSKRNPPDPPPKHARPRRTKPARRPAESPGTEAGTYWIYGHHAVRAALKNPARQAHRLLASRNMIQEIERQWRDDWPSGVLPCPPETVPPAELSRLLPAGAVHQGVALEAERLPRHSLEEICAFASASPPATFLALDQVTDPHNVGAILRSAAVFGLSAVITTDRHAPEESGALAKAASGALDLIPWVRVTNLAQALTALKDRGIRIVGLSEDGAPLGACLAPLATEPVALVMGAEGPGLRRLTAERCDARAALPAPGPLQTLNVSNAAAVACYERSRMTASGSRPDHSPGPES